MLSSRTSPPHPAFEASMIATLRHGQRTPVSRPLQAVLLPSISTSNVCGKCLPCTRSVTRDQVFDGSVPQRVSPLGALLATSVFECGARCSRMRRLAIDEPLPLKLHT